MLVIRLKGWCKGWYNEIKLNRVSGRNGTEGRNSTRGFLGHCQDQAWNIVWLSLFLEGTWKHIPCFLGALDRHRWLIWANLSCPISKFIMKANNSSFVVSKWLNLELDCRFISQVFFSTLLLCSVTKSCSTLCHPMDCSTPGLPVPHHLPEFAQVHVHWMGDASQPSHLLSPPSLALNLSQYQGLFCATNLDLFLFDYLMWTIIAFC